jgi:hypothetical protein
MKKNLFVLLLTVHSFAAYCNEAFNYAQKNSTNIFTGTVVKTTPYWNKAHTFIYTQNTIIVEQCLKGSLITGQSIEIITEGGQVGEDASEISHSLQLHNNFTSLFLCVENKRYETNFDTSNSVFRSIDDSEFGAIKFFNAPVNPFAFGFNQSFLTESSLIEFLKNYNELKPLVLNANKTDIVNQLNNAIVGRKNTQLEVDEYFKELNLKIANRKKSNSKLKASKINPNVNYYIENSKITTSGTNTFLEFDILVNTNANNIYFDNGVVRLTYNTDIFGHTAFADGLVTTSNGQVVTNTTVYKNVDAYDYNNDTLGIGVGSNYSTTNIFGNRFLLSTAKKTLTHVTLKFKNAKNCAKKSNLKFVTLDELNAFGFFEVYTATANAKFDGSATIDYNAIASNNLLNYPLCANPVIDMFDTSIIAGRGKTLTIKGYNLGDINKSVLTFKNCDDGGATNVELDKVDVKIWNDTLIKILFPSQCDSGVAGNLSNNYKPLPGRLGSGVFTIINTSTGLTANSPKTIDVHYSVITQRLASSLGLTNVKPSRNLIKQNTTTGGYLFTPSLAIKNDTAAIRIIKLALAKWRCATGVNFKLDSINTSELGRADDQLNTISFSDTISSLARTSNWPKICSNKAYSSNIDIVIKSPSAINWFMGSETVDVPAGKYDLLYTILHELGHAHNLGHVNDTKELMYYSKGSQATLAANRIINIPNSPSAFDGGNDVTTYSTGVSCANPIPAMALTLDCSYHQSQSLSHHVLTTSYNVYPNPITDVTHLTFDLESTANVQIAVINILGEVVLAIPSKTLLEGNHTLSVNSNNLPTGIYVTNLIVNGSVYSKKLIKY